MGIEDAHPDDAYFDIGINLFGPDAAMEVGTRRLQPTFHKVITSLVAGYWNKWKRVHNKEIDLLPELKQNTDDAFNGESIAQIVLKIIKNH